MNLKAAWNEMCIDNYWVFKHNYSAWCIKFLSQATKKSLYEEKEQAKKKKQPGAGYLGKAAKCRQDGSVTGLKHKCTQPSPTFANDSKAKEDTPSRLTPAKT